MNAIDITILSVLGISAGISFIRGFLREVLSLIAWVAAAWFASRYFHQISDFLTDWIPFANLRDVIAFILLFIAGLLVCSPLNSILIRLLKNTGLGSMDDRFFGMLFGAARGGIIVMVVVSLIVLLSGGNDVVKEDWWRQSVLLGYYDDIEILLRGALPNDISTHLALD
ncbi:MAG: CvpA family protein [Gammaproteobacteria bacterium]|nr:CvpA family protein [Gammaproteobacteria bacterium]MDH5729014.1 CvpA family protein [Gammaproteobacteria bacterium]